MTGSIKHFFLTVLLLACNQGYSQINFELASEIKADFKREFHSISSADLDNDGDTDVVLGRQIYLNQGNGSLIEKKGAINNSSQGWGSSIGDLDGDGDIDVFIKPEGELFLNDGNASFTYKVSPMENLYSTPSNNIEEAELIDLDSDGDLDCFVYDGAGRPYLFINDGNSNFTKVTNSVFPNISNFPEIHVEDLDNDGDEDIIVNGSNSNGAITRIYLNEGDLLFNLLPADLPLIFKGSIATGDIDSDGDKDLLMTGENLNGLEYTEILINQGDLNFLSIDNALEDLSQGSIELIDVDSDLDLDLILTGVRVRPGREQTTLYINDGNANFTMSSSNFAPVRSFYGGTAEGIRKLDVDQDGDEDLIIAGITHGNIKSSHLYINNGDVSFTKIGTSPFSNYEKSSTVTGDLNNDGWDDVIIMGLKTGYNNVDNTSCDIYINTQNNEFNLTQSFHGAHLGDLKLADLDQDGDLDFILSGNQRGDSGPGYSNPLASIIVTKMFVNDGNGFFEEDLDQPFVPVWYSSIEVLDFDGDDDNDLIITGLGNSTNSYTISIYENDGSGGLSQKESSIPDIIVGDIESGDLDGDGDIDLIICGFSEEGDAGGRITKIYFNDGTGEFEDSNLELVGFGNGSISIADTDLDGDLDFIQTGSTTRFGDSNFLPLNAYTFYYLNNGDGSFTRTSPVLIGDSYMNSFVYLQKGTSSIFRDIDNDNDLDFIITGQEETQFGGNSRIEIYLNNGFGDFFSISTTMIGSGLGFLTMTDFDNDGREDILLSDAVTGRLYKNSTIAESLLSLDVPIEDQFFNEGFGTAAINTSNTFINAQGELAYLVSTEALDIVTNDYDFENSELILSEGTNRGETYITITAIDENGSIAADKFLVKVNGIPNVINAISDQKYIQDFNSAAIDISSRYSDPDEDELTYTIEVLDESIISASYLDGILTINEGAITGETTVSVTIDDGNTGVIFDEFFVKVEEPLSIDNDKSLLVYPNPSPQNFILVGSGFSNVDVKSIDGKQLNYFLIERGDEVVVQFNEEYKGILILKVEIEGQKIIKKIIKY